MNLADKVEKKGEDRMKEVGTLKEGELVSSPSFESTADKPDSVPDLVRDYFNRANSEDHLDRLTGYRAAFDGRKRMWLDPRPHGVRKKMVALLFKGRSLS